MFPTDSGRACFSYALASNILWPLLFIHASCVIPYPFSCPMSYKLFHVLYVLSADFLILIVVYTITSVYNLKSFLFYPAALTMQMRWSWWQITKLNIHGKQQFCNQVCFYDTRCTQSVQEPQSCPMGSFYNYWLQFLTVPFYRPSRICRHLRPKYGFPVRNQI